MTLGNNGRPTNEQAAEGEVDERVISLGDAALAIDSTPSARPIRICMERHLATLVRTLTTSSAYTRPY